MSQREGATNESRAEPDLLREHRRPRIPNPQLRRGTGTTGADASTRWLLVERVPSVARGAGRAHGAPGPPYGDRWPRLTTVGNIDGCRVPPRRLTLP